MWIYRSRSSPARRSWSRKKTQRNIAQYDALGRHDLANPVHGVNELSHCYLTSVSLGCGGIRRELSASSGNLSRREVLAIEPQSNRLQLSAIRREIALCSPAK